MILDPIIQVECDECGEIIELHLTKTGRGWDDRNVKEALKEQRWILSTMGNETFCSIGCQILYEEEE